MKSSRQKKVNHKNLEYVIGCIEWTSYAVSNANFFINRLRYLLYHSAKWGCAYIPQPVQNDLHLYLEFIKQAAQGTSINNLIFWNLSHIYFADSCPFGMGGYSVISRTWRFYTPYPSEVNTQIIYLNSWPRSYQFGSMPGLFRRSSSVILITSSIF